MSGSAYSSNLISYHPPLSYSAPVPPTSLPSLDSISLAPMRALQRCYRCLFPGICITCSLTSLSSCLNVTSQDLPGGRVVKNPPASAGDTGSSPGPGGSHMPPSNEACVPQLLKPTRLEPVLCNKRSHNSEKPVHRNRVAPARCN